MLDKLFPDFRTAAFVLLLLAVGVAGVFGYAGWTPTPEQSDLVNAIVELVKALMLLYGGVYVGAKVTRAR